MHTYVKDFYTESCNEEERLMSRSGQVEYLTTMKYIHKYLSEKTENVRILEVGAGTGRYSVALAREGYSVDALELVEHNLNILKSKIQRGDKLNAKQGNALDLSEYKDETFDITLVLGPMYHMFTEEDKKRVLGEAVRVTKSGGILFVAYCMNEATLLQYCFQDKNINRYVEGEKLTEDFRFKSDPSEIFDLVRVEDIVKLTKQFPVKRENLVATDGAATYMSETLEDMTEKEYEYFLQFHFSTCERQDLIGASNHSLDILKKG